jgi:RNA polymerase sigma-70 factor (ECF subfamily)
MAISLDLDVAREITQEAFMRLWEQRNRLAPDSRQEAWLMRVTVNLAISHRRVLLARLRHRPTNAPAPDPAALAIRHIESEHVRFALLKLRPRERAILALRYGRDMSFAEIGNLLGEAEGTVRTSSHRAVQKLRAQLNEWLVDEKRSNKDAEVALKG